MNRNFREFFESLNANGVEYLVVGGYAVAFYGHPRYTKDIDIWINCSEENATKLLRAFDDFGFGDLGLVEADFLTSDGIIQLGYPPNRIDIISNIAGVDFEECFKRKRVTEFSGVPVNMIDIEDLKANKRATGRYQDLADLENLG